MGILRAAILGGPAYAAYGAGPVKFQLRGSSVVTTAMVTEILRAGLYGAYDEVYKDLVIRATVTPQFYDATVTAATLFPYISQAAAVVGKSIFGTADVPCKILSVNGDVFEITAAAVGRMPDMTLAVDKPIFGPMEIWGIVGTGKDPQTANSYYTLQSGQSFAAPSIPNTSFDCQQSWVGVWGAVTGFGAIIAQDGWTITHELELDPVIIQGRTLDIRLGGYRAMARCKPANITAAQIDAALEAQGSLVHGAHLSTNANDLAITGGITASVVTLKAASLKSAGYRFGIHELLQDEIGFVSTLSLASGTPTAAMTLA